MIAKSSFVLLRCGHDNNVFKRFRCTPSALFRRYLICFAYFSVERLLNETALTVTVYTGQCDVFTNVAGRKRTGEIKFKIEGERRLFEYILSLFIDSSRYDGLGRAVKVAFCSAVL